jgi:hypothetical protein
MQVLVPSYVDRINKVLAWLAKAVPQNLIGQLNIAEPSLENLERVSQGQPGDQL